MGKAVILGLLASLALWAQQASLEGTTVDAVTQAPLAGVHVSLVSTGVETNLPEPDDAYGAISDKSGHYSIRNIRPGAYRLNPARAGFVYVDEKNAASGAVVTLKPAQQSGSYKIAMTPEATIRGRVLDEFGDPMQGVSVRVVAADVAPYGAWTMRAETDDRGDYRISGIPGAYYIEASPRSFETGGPPEIRTDGTFTTSYATTYYPGALAQDRGKVVQVAPAQDLTGIDIRIARQKSLKISGVVTTKDGAGVRAVVTIIVRHNGGEGSDQTVAAPDGTFAFANLAPAEYRLQARLPSQRDGDETLWSPIVPVTIETDDATIPLTVTAGEVMPGTVKLVGDGPEKPNEKWAVHLTPLEPHGIPPQGGRIESNGSFLIIGIIPGVYRVTVDPLPGNAYIGSMLQGGAPVPLPDLDLSKGVGRSALSLTVNRSGAQISGSILDAAGQPFSGRALLVVLATDPTDPTMWRSVPTADSRFALRGIRPGKYRLFAVDPAQFGRLTSLAQLKGAASRTAEIEIKDGDQLLKNLQLTGKDGADAK